MPKVSVYLPDDLYREARDRDLPISTLAQQALREALAVSRNEEWIDRVRARAGSTRRTLDTSAVMDEVRGEFGT